MAQVVKPEQVAFLWGLNKDGSSDWKSGEYTVARFGFNPDKCKIEVEDNDSLVVTQEGYYVTHVCSPEFYAIVKEK